LIDFVFCSANFMLQAPLIESARPHEREAAFRLLHQHYPTDEREKRVANALQLLEFGKLRPDGLLVARTAQGICGVILSLPIPGASGLVWPPRVNALPERLAIEDALVRQTCIWLRQQGARLGQALLGEEEIPFVEPLERGGFRRVTSLWHMRHNGRTAPKDRSASKLNFEPYGPSSAKVFQQTLLRTYEGSRDCPEVNGVRTIEEILDGHRADTGGTPRYWWLAREGSRPVGVLLASEALEWEAWELAYLGIVPEARGRGLGRQLLAKILQEARTAEINQLTLCVDARNGPAIDLYQQFGFERYEQREVYLAIFSASRSG
jgi:ribosomal protein S18 acetylase RimI-like enzyme